MDRPCGCVAVNKTVRIPTAYSCSIHKAHASQDTQLTSMRQHEHAILHAYEAWRIWGWTSQEHCQALLVPAREILRASWAQAVHCALSNVKPPALWACSVQLYWLDMCILTLITDGSLLTSGC